MEESKAKFFEFKDKILEFIDEISLEWPDQKQQQHFHDLVDYTIAGGKCLRGLLSVFGFLELTGYSPDSKEAEAAYALGWVQEILQASFLVADDLMDKSPLRRDKPCWYCLQENKYTAVSDSYFLENVLYMIIDKYFADFPVEVVLEIKHLLHITTLRTALGQYIDMHKKEPTIDNWTLTVTNKTAYYTIWQPFLSGIVASQKIPAEVWQSKPFEDALIKAGVLFQCQDDWLDQYGQAAVTGKVGTDIQDGKVSWLFAKAMEVGNEEQRKLLLENVGHHEPEKVQIVRDIYKALNIQKLSEEAQLAQYKELETYFSKVDPRLPQKTIKWLLGFLELRKY
ncbi:Polyprenyl synthetase family protein [Trichomonas vaginalis G3]|uniref:Polyprenyl synthetase family protein n=1 Tax=Trichomonas vaginalis (strain ATCC PRA-98 / G3) TaxID=412133 RepID=A2EN50_TRIV3|nr:dimethylallyltranstransferase protein [Trichomonas vaginalis G3]EAY05887.1 Polyprenyl synthetase family protein [Trichomonas vaginalis G3]KAI5520229.1 dimethylallyltranstransferase protein [Trichomonas vaginalis G3]|eukprot:XP_001318110.1 Polyprenyl synthetase family protein [Trichomonas vaginalis G3]